MLKIKNIEKSFGQLKAVNGVSLEIEKDDIYGLIGPNGSGKSTLFNIISGFYRKDKGEIYFDGERIDDLLPNQIVERGLCRTFQVSRAPERMTVLENMLLAARNQVGENPLNALLKRPLVAKSRERNLKKAKELLNELDLFHLKDEYSGNLSGGQKKLLALGRIFMLEPKMVLLDEPTAGVNPTLTNSILAGMQNLREKTENSFFIVEHDMGVISDVCKKVFVLNSGEILAEGSPEEIQRDDKVLDAYLGRN